MKLVFLSVLVWVALLAPSAARAEASCSSPGPALPAPSCRAPRIAIGTVLELTRGGPAMMVGGASLQIEVGATRFAITMSLPL
jgi:hypothetical protein